MSLALATVLAAAAAQPPAAAAEPQWRSLGVHAGIEIAYDPASVRNEAGKIRVRLRGIAQAAGQDGMRTVTGTTELDCAAGTATALDARGYDAAGSLVLNAIVPAAEREALPIRPGSPNEAVRRELCR